MLNPTQPDDAILVRRAQQGDAGAVFLRSIENGRAVFVAAIPTFIGIGYLVNALLAKRLGLNGPGSNGEDARPETGVVAASHRAAASSSDSSSSDDAGTDE